MAELRVGIIGLGIGEQHVVGYDLNPHCKVVAICDRKGEKLERVQTRVTGVRTSRDSTDVINDPAIDVLSIASNDEDHFDHVCHALSCGKHVFIEKPICQSLSQLREIKHLWSRANGSLKLKSNLVLRGAPLYRWVKQQVQSGEIGQVYSFDGDYLYGRLSKLTDGWRATTENYSVMEGGGIHLIDLMVWMTGQRPETIHAVGNRVCSNGTRFRYEDFVAATMTFSSRMIGRITANFGCVHGHQHVVRLFGTKGTFVHDDKGPRYQAHRDPAPPAESLSYGSLSPSKYVLINDFIDAVLRDRNIEAETQADFDVMSICIASDHALRTHSVAEIQYV